MSNSASNPSIRRRALVPKEDCPLAQAAELLADRWTILILREAFYGVTRYHDMLADLEAPRSMLTDRLAKMVESGLLTRQAYKEAGERQRNAYVLTAMGRDLAKTLIALTEWGETHLLQGPAPVTVVNKTSGATLRVALVDQAGKPASIDEAELRLSKR